MWRIEAGAALVPNGLSFWMGRYVPPFVARAGRMDRRAGITNRLVLPHSPSEQKAKDLRAGHDR
jgi:hypothetical protein